MTELNNEIIEAIINNPELVETRSYTEEWRSYLHPIYLGEFIGDKQKTINITKNLKSQSGRLWSEICVTEY